MQKNQKITLGDPALLLSELSPIRPNINPSHHIGIIPHYADKDMLSKPALVTPIKTLKRRISKNFKHNNIESQLTFGDINARIIDVQAGDCEHIIQQICDCAFIASSSLHGLIIADALGIPNTWIKLSDKLDGGPFKFIDYMRSVGRYDVNPLQKNKGQIDRSFIGKILERQNQWSFTFDVPRYKDAFDNFISTEAFKICGYNVNKKST